MNIRRAFLKASIPIQRVMDKVHRPDFIVTGEFCWDVEASAIAGDVLVERINWNLTNPFIEGFWKHAAIVASSDRHVIEAVGTGVRKVPLNQWILSKDYCLHLRPRCSPREMIEAAVEGESYVGSPYDFLFESDNKEFYCSELVRQVYRTSMTIETRLKNEILPVDIAESHLFTVINDSRHMKYGPHSF